jgi:hypothetical protein
MADAGRAADNAGEQEDGAGGAGGSHGGPRSSDGPGLGAIGNDAMNTRSGPAPRWIRDESDAEAWIRGFRWLAQEFDWTAARLGGDTEVADPNARARLGLLLNELDSLHIAFVKDTDRRFSVGLAGNQHGDTITAAEVIKLAGELRQLANDVEQQQARLAAGKWKQRFNPDDVDPNYRRAVENYFETLSRGEVGTR